MTSSPTKILIATADHQLARAYADRLGRTNFDVYQSEHPDHVLQNSLDFQPELVILDLELGTDEHDLLTILSQTPETAHVKVILLSGLIDPALRSRAHDLGAVEVLIKSPATIPDVIKRVHHHTTRKRQTSRS